jgi:hypothetical protein
MGFLKILLLASFWAGLMSVFRQCFEDQDPRTGNAASHELLDELRIAVTASIRGAESGLDFNGSLTLESAISPLPAPARQASQENRMKFRPCAPIGAPKTACKSIFERSGHRFA